MTSSKLQDVLCRASISVLETMFFADILPAADATTHVDAVTCVIDCKGAATGSFVVAVDRPALHVLCCAFLGEEEAGPATQEWEMICELTNMLAGSTLSAYVPEHFCKLSSPSICDFARQYEISSENDSDTPSAFIALSIEGGLLSVSCSLRTTR
jgi:CheY-specific phosphatase CheX